MTRFILASLIGLMAFAQDARADRDGRDLGRYQVVLGAQVPGQSGKAGTRAMLVDTSTGQSWVLVSDSKAGGDAGVVWMPIKLMPPKGSQTAKAPEDSRVQESSTSDQTIRRRTRPLNFDYENDP